MDLENAKKIVNGIKAGDKKSFDELYEEYYLILFRTAYLILGNKEDSEDVLQDTFVSIYTNINRLKNPSKLKSWIFTILKNTAYTKYKNRKREFPDDEISNKVDVEINSNLENEIAIKSDLKKCLMALGPKEREVIVLYYFNEFSIREIAKIQRTFEGTVKSRLYRARKKLKKEIDDLDENFLKESIYE
ncbi:RNA polymerase sigma factor [Peptoniphilus sp. MSJ-1]|uniref:RNA polymerase sigma factor n=1 Tax=Peptoniphilus ovalis TaxID=2841503 RepID=A0ABS6FDQ9_9FIRM|nr:RNA polymerase sigma factor [Peptoniphilus ovalis]MBU5668316.1 RNA polymerase sigma factor [Peptoniphilus ovalis]